jgi:hypothetical protein
VLDATMRKTNKYDVNNSKRWHLASLEYFFSKCLHRLKTPVIYIYPPMDYINNNILCQYNLREQKWKYIYKDSYLALSVPECYSKNASSALYLISVFLLLVRTIHSWNDLHHVLSLSKYWKEK